MADVKAAVQDTPTPRRRVKRVRKHNAHHGGAWKVAYADFVTAMMALFLVLWLVSQADTKLKQSIASYFRSPGVFDTQKGGILSQAKKVSKEPGNLTSKDDEQALFSVAQTLQKQFSTKPEFSRVKDQVKIELTDEGLKIQLVDKADKVSFESGSAAISADASGVLAEIAQGICALPNQINIGGHTDARPLNGDNGYSNWELSTDRANAARRILQTNCVKPEQIHRVIGFADTDPINPVDVYAPANRRISITILRLEIPKDQNAGSDGEQPAKDGERPPVSRVDKNDPAIRENQKQLQTAGSVVVGEPDKVPDKPKVK